MIAADISSDDLIANAGAAYKYGIVPVPAAGMRGSSIRC